jgi:hypothetical protein
MDPSTSSPRPSPPFRMEERVAEGRERRRAWFRGSKRKIPFGRILTPALSSLGGEREKTRTGSRCARQKPILPHAVLRCGCGRIPRKEISRFEPLNRSRSAEHPLGSWPLRFQRAEQVLGAPVPGELRETPGHCVMTARPDFTSRVQSAGFGSHNFPSPICSGIHK